MPKCLVADPYGTEPVDSLVYQHHDRFHTNNFDKLVPQHRTVITVTELQFYSLTGGISSHLNPALVPFPI